MARVNVQVFLLRTDPRTGERSSTEMREYAFTVLADNPRAAQRQARRLFEQKYGPDLLVVGCNTVGRSDVILYYQPSVLLKTAKRLGTDGFTRDMRPTPRQ